MVKTFVSFLVALVILFSGQLYENFFVEKQFEDFNTSLHALYEKTEEDTVSKEDVLAVQDLWIAKKRKLHMFIPHTEIKEVDLWLAEAVSFAKS